MTLREHLEGLLSRARTPERRAELEDELRLPEFPEALRYLWSAFGRLRRRCEGPITWPDIDAFCRYSGVRLAPWEVALIEDLDDARAEAINEAREDA